MFKHATGLAVVLGSIVFGAIAFDGNSKAQAGEFDTGFAMPNHSIYASVKPDDATPRITLADKWRERRKKWREKNRQRRQELLQRYGVGKKDDAGQLKSGEPKKVKNKKASKTAAPENRKNHVKHQHANGSHRAGKLIFNAPWRCVPPRLKNVIYAVSRKFGSVRINSTIRSRGKNRRIGGARHSYHLHCNAVDFRVLRGSRGVYSFLARQKAVGGLKRYKSGYFHIDTGPRRTW